MRLALIGATSHICKGVVRELSQLDEVELLLYSRDKGRVSQWLVAANITGNIKNYEFAEWSSVAGCDAVVSFIGAGEPKTVRNRQMELVKTADVFDLRILGEIEKSHECRYINLSSGAVFFGQGDPVKENSSGSVPLNNIGPRDFYALSKLIQECRHRARPDLPIVDLRIYSYVSQYQDLGGSSLMASVARALKDRTMLAVGSDELWRDYVAPAEVAAMIRLVLAADPMNDVFDVYSAAPVEKMQLLRELESQLGLKYSSVENPEINLSTANSSRYYSENRRAASLGYRPTRTSLDCVLGEMRLLR